MKIKKCKTCKWYKEEDEIFYIIESDHAKETKQACTLMPVWIQCFEDHYCGQWEEKD